LDFKKEFKIKFFNLAGAASLLVALVPSQAFRQGYRSTKIYSAHHSKESFSLNSEAINILHKVRALIQFPTTPNIN